MLLSNFIFSFNVVMPVFLVLFLGYFLRRDILDEKTADRLNRIVFNYALPLMLFRDIAGSDFTTVFDSKLILFAVFSTLFIFIIIYIFSPKIVKPDEEGAFIQGVFRGNYAIVGLQLIANILGNTQTGKASLTTTFIAPLYNSLAVFALTFKSRDNEKSKISLSTVKSALISIIKNPLILGSLAGIPFSTLRISLPQFIAGSVNLLSNIATPLALLSIGASIDLNQIKRKFKPAVIAAFLKLIVTPLMFVPIALKLGFAGEQIVILFVLFAAPTAVNSYIMADLMNNDSVLAANIVLITIIGSLFTLTIGIFWMRIMGLF